jgi:hypothetical protein
LPFPAGHIGRMTDARTTPVTDGWIVRAASAAEGRAYERPTAAIGPPMTRTGLLPERTAIVVRRVDIDALAPGAEAYSARATDRVHDTVGSDAGRGDGGRAPGARRTWREVGR